MTGTVPPDMQPPKWGIQPWRDGHTLASLGRSSHVVHLHTCAIIIYEY